MSPMLFKQLSVHQKVMAGLVLIVLPVIAMASLSLTTMQRLLVVQDRVDHLMAVQVQTDELLSLVVDVQYGFRGFVITRNEKFLKPLSEAEERLDPALRKLKQMVSDDREQLQMLSEMEAQVGAFLQKKKRLVDAVRLGEMKLVREHFESGEGEATLSRIRADYRAFETIEQERLIDQQAQAARLATMTRYGLAGVVASTLLLWWIGGRLLTRTITGPLAMLTEAARQFGSGTPLKHIPVVSTDELGRLARTMEIMQERIAHHCAQLEAFHAIGKENSTIVPGLQSRLEQLERYSADMAHDLKAPARRMAELASLLQADYKGRFDERADRYLLWIQGNGQQLMARIEEVLRLARIGVVRESVEPVDPAEVIRDVIKGCEGHVERLGAMVRTADRFPKLACNRVHLFQVLDNLIRNALKFSAEGYSPELEIGVRGAGQESVFFVRDNGIGIAEADKNRIFEPFERLGYKEAPGTGIGLAIVKKIIELYQGRVWIESERGKGTTFFFTLPLYDEPAAAEVRRKG